MTGNSFIGEKQQSRATWALGSFGDIASFFPPMSYNLTRAAQVSPDETLLDVACGSGITAITARRLGAKVTGLDITPELLVRAKQEADLAETYDIEWKEGDAESLPFDDDSFDVVLSSFGHIFAPHPDVAAKEIIRVTKRGGRIAFTSWPPENATGRVFAAIAKYIQQPSTKDIPPSPMQWGIPEIVQNQLNRLKVMEPRFERGVVNIPLLSPNHYWQLFSTRFGPLLQAIQTLKGDPIKIGNLKRDIIKAISPYFYDNVLRLDYLIAATTKS